MSRWRLPLRARGALLACVATAMALGTSGCAALRPHPERDCRNPEFTGNTENLPPLKIPAGLTAPDRTDQVKVPTLTAAAPARPADAPCLDWPPPYVSEPPLPPVRHPTQ